MILIPRRNALIAAVAGALTLTACATTREVGLDGEPVYRAEEVDLRPMLLACGDYHPITNRSTAFSTSFRTVRISLVVTADGTVDPRSLRLVDQSDNRQRRAELEALEREAEALARACSYTPAVRGASAVAVRIIEAFRLEVAGMEG